MKKSTAIERIMGVAFLYCLVLGCLGFGCRQESEAKAMLKQAKKTFVATDLQRAVTNLQSRYPTNCDIEISELPKEIRALSPDVPSDAFVVAQSEPRRWELVVRWGGGFHSWGVIICPEGNTVNTNSLVARTIPWNAGVVFFTVGGHSK